MLKGQMKKLEAPLFLLVIALIVIPLIHQMGVENLLSTIMATAHALLLNTVFYIMAVTVLSGALGSLLIEFGLIRILQKLLSPFMNPIFNLPGVASLGAIMTFFSDNPAILSLAKDEKFAKCFKRYQLVSVTNFATAFGMGLIVLTFMMGKGFFFPALLGLVGAFLGSIVATRLMQYFAKKALGDEIVNPDLLTDYTVKESDESSYFMRTLTALLEGGKKGVELGLAVIPGVLIISTLMMLLTFGAKNPELGYQGLAYEGVPLLPMLASYFMTPIEWLLGFQSPELLAFPITSLGSVGAALSLVNSFLERGLAGANEIAVFVAMGICWSGFLSTHSGMYDALKLRDLTSKSLISQTVGGVVAGIMAHFLYVFSKLFL